MAVRALVIPGSPFPSAIVRGARIFRATLEELKTAAAEEGQEDKKHSAEIGVGEKVVNGWRCSYRMEQPEQVLYSEYEPKLTKKMKAMSDVRTAIPEVGRRAPLAARLASARQRADKQLAKAKRKATAKA